MDKSELQEFLVKAKNQRNRTIQAVDFLKMLRLRLHAEGRAKHDKDSREEHAEMMTEIDAVIDTMSMSAVGQSVAIEFLERSGGGHEED